MVSCLFPPAAGFTVPLMLPAITHVLPSDQACGIKDSVRLWQRVAGHRWVSCCWQPRLPRLRAKYSNAVQFVRIANT